MDEGGLAAGNTTFYDWVVWTDVDCFFTRTEDVVDVFDGSYDVHFTLDAGSEERVNTGFFALRNTQWSRDFLEQVWADNDGGEGLSDQRSFNNILNGLSKDEHQRHVKLYSKSILNAFPSGTNYVATEDYEPPTPDGDETDQNESDPLRGAIWRCPQFDGATPPTMLVQFLDLLLARHALYLTKVPDITHERLRSVSDASKLVSDARAALANCLKALEDLRAGRLQNARELPRGLRIYWRSLRRRRGVGERAGASLEIGCGRRGLVHHIVFPRR